MISSLKVLRSVQGPQFHEENHGIIPELYCCGIELSVLYYLVEIHLSPHYRMYNSALLCGL